MVTIWDEQSIGESVALASELRNAGLRVDLYPEADKLGRQLKYASSREIPFVVVSGPEEREQGEVSLRDMRSGEQKKASRGSVVDAIRELMKARR